MEKNVRCWPLQFYFYTRRSGLSHRLRLGISAIDTTGQAEIICSELLAQNSRFDVYQRLWFFPIYIHRPDIRSVFLDEEFFYGIPTSTCVFSLGCSFILRERADTISPI